ncbi:MAG: 50S ribosomal protein L15 [Actinobacteria bacterium]|nr:50S ribosomal protein L15 [Actinomycetota bacterium]
MLIHDVTSKVGSNRSSRRRGRGTGSGLGKTCGRGHKGANSRSGSGGRLLAEGGAKPFYRRLPKRGFSNARYRTRYDLVHLYDLNRFDDGATVDGRALQKAGLIDDPSSLVKILGPGKLDKKLTVLANKFSTSAAKSISDAGGEARIIS